MKNCKCTCGNSKLGVKVSVYHVGYMSYSIETEGAAVEPIHRNNLSQAFAVAQKVAENPDDFIYQEVKA